MWSLQGRLIFTKGEVKELDFNAAFILLWRMLYTLITPEYIGNSKHSAAMSKFCFLPPVKCENTIPVLTNRTWRCWDETIYHRLQSKSMEEREQMLQSSMFPTSHSCSYADQFLKQKWNWTSSLFSKLQQLSLWHNGEYTVLAQWSRTINTSLSSSFLQPSSSYKTLS